MEGLKDRAEKRNSVAKREAREEEAIARVEKFWRSRLIEREVKRNGGDWSWSLHTRVLCDVSI